MKILTIDGHTLRRAIIAGTNELEKHKDYVDSLNVFPVPDGDTGINMSLTCLAAGREVEKLNTPNIYEVAKAASNGSLRGARGNSGVILSQLFRGFAKGLEGKDVATAEDLAYAFEKAKETAYKAVMKPKEGTILTLARSIAEYSIDTSFDTEDIIELMEGTLKYGNKILSETTEMLPELKQAGVVDSGARGLLYILEGAFGIKDMEGDIELSAPTASKSIGVSVADIHAAANANVDIKYGYCTEFFVNVDKVTDEMEEGFKRYLETIGDSIVVVGDEDIIKIHVHTDHPGLALEKALKTGNLSNLKIENMRLQHTNLINFQETKEHEHKPAENILTEPSEKKETGFIAVSAGEGLKELFKSIGADVIIEGGQTMNPSTEDILAAIEGLNADNIFILPNNKNIVLAAEQAAELSEKNVYVIATKSVPQGISALISYAPEKNPEENIEHLNEAVSGIVTGQVTYAVRASNFEDKKIEDGDILCMVDGKITNVSNTIEEGSKVLIDNMFAKKAGEVMSIYFGEGITEEDAYNLSAYVEEKYPDCEVAVMEGGQPLYYYIISLE
ncbi:DAK2 domain-containing protein [Anaeropeptidivorans aminofermentans]|uniref:DAK2 domain-containing protein n=1 Tax=Anaeropeptidivorans aminofermentans TaxID=2934315 RepID=UPI002024B9BE|nr:DAK2 domain-containing protein [Anaeropeptidivorans aminofermentans]